MPKGKGYTPAVGTPDAPLYEKGASETPKNTVPAAAPAAVVRPVPMQTEIPPEPQGEAPSTVLSIRDALEATPVVPLAEAPPAEDKAETPAPEEGKPTPKAAARLAEKPAPAAKPDDVVRLRADLAGTKRNEQELLRQLAARDAEIVAAQQETDEVAKAASEGTDAESVAAIRQKWTAQRTQRQSEGAVADVGNDIDQFLSEAGYPRDEKNPQGFAPHPVVDRIAQVYKTDPPRAWTLAYEEWRRVVPSPRNGTAATAPAQPTSPRPAGAATAGPKTYTEAEVTQRVEEAEQRARDEARDEALTAASTAGLPEGVVGRDLNAEFWTLEPSEKIRAGLVESQKGR